QIDGGGTTLGNQLRQTLPDRRAGFERGATIACHAVEPLIRLQATNDGSRIWTLHEHARPVASHHTLMHDRETLAELLSTEINIVLRDCFTIVVGISLLGWLALSPHQGTIAINGTCPEAIDFINVSQVPSRTR